MAGSKLLDNPAQAYALGATWGTPAVDNTLTTEFAWLINNTGLTLFTGDIVTLDATGTLLNQPLTATLSMVIGTVGSPAEFGAYPAQENVAGVNVVNTFPTIVGGAAGTGISALTTDGNAQPFTDPAWITGVSMGFTLGSATVTYAGAAAVDLGKYIYTPYNAATNPNPQVFQITAVSVGVSYTVIVISNSGGQTSTAFNGTTGTFLVSLGRDTTTRGPGWTPPAGWTSSSAFNPGTVTPIVTRGYGRVNVNGLTTTVAGDLISGTNASFVGTRTAQGLALAGQIGQFIAVPLEAYAQRDTTLTTAGFTGHDSVRAIIGKF